MDILLLHGALGSKSQLEELKNLLSEKVDVHTLNFSGHGGKKFENDFGIQQFSNELKTYLSSYPEKKFCVFGYSMGGYVALYLEKTYPGTFFSVYTLATKFDWNEETSVKEAAMLNAEIILEKVPSYALQLELRHEADNWRNLLIKTASMMLAMGKNPPLAPDDFSKIEIPVIISRGDLDRMVSKEESLLVSNAIPNGYFKSYPNWAHPIEKINIEILAADLLAFFNQGNL